MEYKCYSAKFMYAFYMHQLSRHDKEILDASSMGSFTSKKIDAKRDLIEK